LLRTPPSVLKGRSTAFINVREWGGSHERLKPRNCI